jgi:phosphatidylglycerol---prolipoprotein diacylglyceryl transferase
MHPELIHFQLPSFLSSIFHIGEVTIYSYAFCVAFGSLLTVLYTKWAAKKYLEILDLPNHFFYNIFICGFVGGKVFYFLERPMLYFSQPNLLLDNFSGGFVFYGSFVIAIVYVIWYLRKNHIPLLPMLDILAITTLISHSIGRIGCFMAGCCYGLPTSSRFGIVFPNSNPVSVHPTQLYEAFVLFSIMIGLLILRKIKHFDGQLFILYVGLYALSRVFLELFRGDDRGYIIQNIISPSQLIALILFTISLFFYFKLNPKIYH